MNIQLFFFNYQLTNPFFIIVTNIIFNTGYSDNGIAGTLFSSRLMPTLVLEKNNDPDALRYLSLLEKSRIPLRGVLRAGVGVLGAFLRNLF